MNKFKINKRISDGAFGTVYQATFLQHETSEAYPPIIAIKQVYTSSQFLKRELKILSKLPKSKHIVAIYDTITENFMTSIVMERGLYDLSHWISQMDYPIPQSLTKNMAYQIIKGVDQVHQAGIIHRDLKPSNLVVREDGLIGLCDFGSAVECTKGQEYEIQGFTRWYKCPEMLFGYRKYKYEVDIWSLGCIIMQLATGEPIFNGKSQIEQLALMAQILGDPSPANWPTVIKLPDYNKINFKPIAPKSIEQIARQRCISQELCKLIFKMVRYQNRLSTRDLLADEYFRDVEVGRVDVLNTEFLNAKNLLLQKAKKFKKL